MSMILGLIMAAIFVYVGVNMEPGLNTTVATITTPTYSSGVVGLNGVILIVFAAMIVFGIVKTMSAAA
jgi:multisubunit Na+/H+ antiporter MnhF subunit